MFSGVVVTYNDGKRLKECLESLAFCSQLVVVDLGSDRKTIDIAIASGAEIHSCGWVPIVEKIRPVAFSYAQSEWIVHLDPDEVFPVQRVEEIKSLVSSRPDLAIVRLPWRFYFKGSPLKGTVWGWKNTKGFVYNRNRVELKPDVHQSIRPLPGYKEVELEEMPNGAVWHYWMDSYRQFFEKHLRYIREEGPSRFFAGERFSWRRCALETIRAFKLSLLHCKGWSGGFREVLLSFFYAWYVLMSLLSLRAYQKRRSPERFEPKSAGGTGDR